MNFTSCSGLGADTLKHDFTGTGASRLIDLGLIWRNISDNELQKDMDITTAPSWRGEYQAIGMCNFILGNIHRAKIPEERIELLQRQALTIRAYLYFYVLRTWGNAMLITNEEDVGEKP